MILIIFIPIQIISLDLVSAFRGSLYDAPSVRSDPGTIIADSFLALLDRRDAIHPLQDRGTVFILLMLLGLVLLPLVILAVILADLRKQKKFSSAAP